MPITISSERAPEAFTSHHVMVMTTTKAMMTTNVNDEAPWAKVWNFLITLHDGDHNSKNQRRETATVGRRGLVLEHTTYSHRLARHRRGNQTSRR